MKFQTLLLALFLAIAVTACGQTNTNSETQNGTEQVSTPKVVGIDEFKLMMQNEDAQLIDVRTDGEVAEGKIAHAAHIDVMQWDNFVNAVEKLDKEMPVLLYCKSGGRSNKAAIYLSENGFTDVYDLKGGITNWNKSGEETVKP